MSTKVRGDKIKEGSIPLSALSNEVKDKIENAGGGADWNAQEGDAGYIENKPFYTKGDTRQIDVDGDYIISISDINTGDKIDISWDLIYYDGKIFRGSTSFVTQEQSTTYYEKDDFIINGAGVWLEMYVSGACDSLYGKVTVIVNSEVKTLEEKYIPDTVLKTFPQTLSDTDKNQALANLGIDNTKYILSVAPGNKFNIREFIDKFGFIAELNDDGYGGYIGDLIVTNKELFLDKVLCCGFNTSLAKCIYVSDSAEVVFFFEEGLAKGSVKVGFAENDMNSEPTMIGWDPLG